MTILILLGGAGEGGGVVIDYTVVIDLFIPPDDFSLVATEDGFADIMIAPDDYDLTVPEEQMEYGNVYRPYYLTDNSGNKLTDNSGNYLIATVATVENVYSLHAPTDDYSIIVTEET